MLSGAQTVNPRGPFTPAGVSHFDHPSLPALDGSAAVAAGGDSYGVSGQSPLWNMPRTFGAGGSSGSGSYFAELSMRLGRLEADLLRWITDVDLDDPDFVATLLSFDVVANETSNIVESNNWNNKVTKAQYDSLKSLRRDVIRRVNSALDARIIEGLSRSINSSGLRDDTASWLTKTRDVIGRTLNLASFNYRREKGEDASFPGSLITLNYALRPEPDYSLRALSERRQSGLAASFYRSSRTSPINSVREELYVLLLVTAVQEAFTPERLNVINAIKDLITLSNYNAWNGWKYGQSAGTDFREFMAWGMTYLAHTSPDAATDLKVWMIFEDLLSRMRFARAAVEANVVAKDSRRSFWDRLLGRKLDIEDDYYWRLYNSYSEEFGAVMDATASARSAGIEEMRRAIAAASGSSTPPAPATPAPSGSGAASVVPASGAAVPHTTVTGLVENNGETSGGTSSDGAAHVHPVTRGTAGGTGRRHGENYSRNTVVRGRALSSPVVAAPPFRVPRGVTR